MVEKFGIKGATINFIYSFLPVTNEMSLSSAILERIYDLYKDKKDFVCGEGKPGNRTGISSYLALNIEMGYMAFPEFSGKLESGSVIIDVVVQPMVRVFPLGSSCCITVSASKKQVKREKGKGAEEQNIDVKDVNRILHLVSQIKNSVAKYKISRIKSDHYSFKGNKSTVYNVFKFVTDRIVKDFNDKYHDPNVKLDLLCKEHLNIKLKEPKCPWVVSILELEGTACEVFCGSIPSLESPRAEKSRAIRSYEEVIAPILYRSVTGEDFQIEPAYINPPMRPEGMGIYNMNLDARLFLHMSRRSILCMCQSQDKNPATYFIPVLLDLCERSHSRWQSLIVLNKILDESLRNFTERESQPKEKLQKMIKLINKFTICLEDPTTYVISGDALREIHEKLVDTYRLKDLMEVVLKKVDMLERLYRHGIELRWADDL